MSCDLWTAWKPKTPESNKSDFCLPHASIRQPLSQPEPTKGSGSAKQWRPCTPAMAAGLTDHVWTFEFIPIQPSAATG
jgi:hypothetical protein